MWRHALAGGLLALSGCNLVFGNHQANLGSGGGDDIDAPSGSDGSNDTSCVALGCGDDPNTPVCGDDGNCRACEANSECGASNACIPADFTDALLAGTCADELAVAYVTPTGSGTDCSKTLPCSLATALSTDKAFIHVSGQLSGNIAINTPRTFLGDPGSGITGTEPVIASSSDLHVYNMDITGMGNGRVVDITGGTAFLEGVHVTNGKFGIVSLGSKLTVTRSKIDSNDLGGISVQAGGFDITNDFVVANGTFSKSGSIGGIDLQTSDASSRLEYDTISDNQRNGGAAGGLNCAFGPMVVNNVILSGNLKDSSVINLAGCTTAHSIDVTTTSSLNFKDSGGLDYHLTAASTLAVDQGQAGGGTPVNIDFDGNSRPQHNIPDIGAHELPQ